MALVLFGAMVESAALRNFADFALPKDYLGLLSHPQPFNPQQGTSSAKNPVKMRPTQMLKGADGPNWRGGKYVKNPIGDEDDAESR